MQSFPERSRTSRFTVWGAFVMAAAALVGCGKVVVDGEPTGNGGSGDQGGSDHGGSDHGGSDKGGGGSGDTGGDGGTTTSTTSTTTTSTTTTITIDPDEVTPACKSYCDEVTQTKGCFDLPDCHARCMGFYVEGCTAQVEAVLACIPPWLTDACQITYPDAGGCYAEMWDLSDCAVDAFSTCQSWGGELVDDSACTGIADCPAFELGISCDATGACICAKDNVEVGSCGMPFSGAEACSVLSNCCRAFL